MPAIDKIDLRNSFVRQNLKETLGYAVKKRNGYYKDIKMVDDRRGEIVDTFESAGFVRIGETFKERTFSITKLGDDYYKDLFGKMNYYQKRISGAWERFKNRIFNKEKNTL